MPSNFKIIQYIEDMSKKGTKWGSGRWGEGEYVKSKDKSITKNCGLQCVEHKVLYVSTKHNLIIMLFKTSIYVMFFFLLELSV